MPTSARLCVNRLARLILPIKNLRVPGRCGHRPLRLLYPHPVCESPSPAGEGTIAKKGLHFRKSYDIIPSVPGQNIGMSPSGKAPDFDSGIRRFKSGHPSQDDPLAQLAEQLPFKQWVRGSNPRRVTMKSSESACFRNFFFAFRRKKFVKISERFSLLQTRYKPG